MATEQNIAINPDLLVWAREESGYGIERVATRLQVKEDRVATWESGRKQPTLRQIQELARFYHRPLSVFFLPQRPRLTPLAAEYRRLPGVEPGHESPELRLALRQMVGRREAAINLMEELGAAVPEFALRTSLSTSPEKTGAMLRQAVGVSDEAQLAWENEWDAWRAWRAALEQIGVLVFQFTKVPLSEARGLSLLRIPLPVVAINGKEIPETKSFTLLHETVHLMLAASNEEAPAVLERRRGDKWLEVERYAESAAGHALVPTAMLRRVVTKLRLDGAGWDIDHVRHVARRFRISPLAMATRLREAGYMDWEQYRRWRAQWEARVASLPPRNGGFATPLQKSLGRAGRPFAQLVVEALDANRITAVDASRLLDLKYVHFDKLRAHLRHEPPDAILL